MKTRGYHHRNRTTSQGMVEFALILPIFLLIVLGVIEMGRLLFIYGVVYTSTREGARYGAASGISSNHGLLYFQDCTGIRDNALRIGRVVGITPADILISYDNPDNHSKTFPSACNDSDPANPQPTTANISVGDRVVVDITLHYAPITKLVPIPGFNIHSRHTRTVIRSVGLPGNGIIPPTALPTYTWTPSLTPTITLTPTPGPSPTPTQTFTPTATNTPTATLDPRTPTPTITNTPSPTPTFTPSPTATPLPVCPVAGPLTIEGQKMSISFSHTNTGAKPTSVLMLIVGWHPQNGQSLLDITFRSNTVYQGPDLNPPTVLPQEGWTGNEFLRTIYPGEVDTILLLTFGQEIDLTKLSDYSVTVVFDNMCPPVTR